MNKGLNTGLDEFLWGQPDVVKGFIKNRVNSIILAVQRLNDDFDDDLKVKLAFRKDLVFEKVKKALNGKVIDGDTSISVILTMLAVKSVGVDVVAFKKSFELSDDDLDEAIVAANDILQEFDVQLDIISGYFVLLKNNVVRLNVYEMALGAFERQPVELFEGEDDKYNVVENRDFKPVSSPVSFTFLGVVDSKTEPVKKSCVVGQLSSDVRREIKALTALMKMGIWPNQNESVNILCDILDKVIGGGGSFGAEFVALVGELREAEKNRGAVQTYNGASDSKLKRRA